MRSLAACVAASAMDNLGMLQWTGENSAMPAIRVDFVFVLWGAHEPHSSRSSKITALVLGGAKRTTLKSWFPLSCASAESQGFVRDVWRRFKVRVACGRSKSHKNMGKSRSVEHNPAIKWFLDVRIACSTALTL
eukprot:12483128-Ditylum_brightwellii.AAC.1